MQALIFGSTLLFKPITMRSGLIFTLFLFVLCGNVVAITPAICKRSFSSSSVAAGQEITVTVEINKGSVNGIAKLLEEIPEGLTAYEGNSSAIGGVFTFEQQKLKIVWLNVPSQNVFKVTYKLKATGDIKNSYHIIGKFSYVMNEVREEFFLSEGILLGATAPSNLQASVSNNIVIENVASTVKSDSAALVKEAAKVKVVESAETVYKVQLGVFGSKKDASVFKNLTDISNEEVGGKYKYYSGSFSNKADAEKRVEEARKIGFSGAYVVPFVNGKRVN